MNAEKKVSRALNTLPEEIRLAILQCTTLSEIATHVPEETAEQKPILAKYLKRSIAFPVPLSLAGKLRRSARYGHLYYKDHAVHLDPAVTLNELSSRITHPHALGSTMHLAKIIRIIQSLIVLEEVESFMVGKASVQESEDPHAHTAMVSRFGDKYKACGYTHLFGLCVLDGHDLEDAEFSILQMESTLHHLYAKHDKYDRDLSNAQSGALSKSPSTAYFTLYVAIRCFHKK